MRRQGRQGPLEKPGAWHGTGGGGQLRPLEQDGQPRHSRHLLHFPVPRGDPGVQGRRHGALLSLAVEAHGIREPGQGFGSNGLEFHFSPLLGARGEFGVAEGAVGPGGLPEGGVAIPWPQIGPGRDRQDVGRSSGGGDAQAPRLRWRPVRLPLHGLVRKADAPGEVQGTPLSAVGRQGQFLPDRDAEAFELGPFPVGDALGLLRDDPLHAAGLGAFDPLPVALDLLGVRSVGPPEEEDKSKVEPGAHDRLHLPL